MKLACSRSRGVLFALLIAGLGRGAEQRTHEEILKSDPDRQARIAAADALGRRAPASTAVETLLGALEKERDPRVVDAIVSALDRLRAPISEPQKCLDVAGRAWDAATAKPLFECWRASAGAADVLNAALSGPATLRALALRSVTEELGAGRRTADAPTRDRLTDSAIEVMERGKELAASTAGLLHASLWDLTGHDFASALRTVDRMTSEEARLAASEYLSRQNLDAYLAARRPRQTWIGLLVAGCCALLMIPGKVRRLGAWLAGSCLVWVAWTWIAKDVRQLPPPSLSLLTTSFLAFLSAGLMIALVGWLPWEKIASRFIRAFGRAGLAAALAGMLAAIATLWTRSSGWFPVLQEGWDLVVEPLGSLNLGILAGLVFALVDGFLFHRQPPKPPEPDPLAGIEWDKV